jgi:hypothetical protein
VTAGIGAFNSSCKPIITINGKIINQEPDGAATYKIVAGGKPGNHFIPVTISYFKPDGVRATVSKKLEYTIAE